MGNLQKATASAQIITMLNHEPADDYTKLQKEKYFLRRYDEVLNKYILSLFRKTMEEMERSPDHRAVKIIGGEVVRLRLDSLQGQADGIKVFFEKEMFEMYIWFSPDLPSEKISFKMLYGGKSRKERYALDAITKEFLMELIAKKFMLFKRSTLN